MLSLESRLLISASGTGTNEQGNTLLLNSNKNITSYVPYSTTHNSNAPSSAPSSMIDQPYYNAPTNSSTPAKEIAIAVFLVILVISLTVGGCYLFGGENSTGCGANAVNGASAIDCCDCCCCPIFN